MLNLTKLSVAPVKSQLFKFFTLRQLKIASVLMAIMLSIACGAEPSAPDGEESISDVGQETRSIGASNMSQETAAVGVTDKDQEAGAAGVGEIGQGTKASGAQNVIEKIESGSGSTGSADSLDKKIVEYEYELRLEMLHWLRNARDIKTLDEWNLVSAQHEPGDDMLSSFDSGAEQRLEDAYRLAGRSGGLEGEMPNSIQVLYEEIDAEELRLDALVHIANPRELLIAVLQDELIANGEAWLDTLKSVKTLAEYRLALADDNEARSMLILAIERLEEAYELLESSGGPNEEEFARTLETLSPQILNELNRLQIQYGGSAVSNPTPTGQPYTEPTKSGNTAAREALRGLGMPMPYFSP